MEKKEAELEEAGADLAAVRAEVAHLEVEYFNPKDTFRVVEWT